MRASLVPNARITFNKRLRVSNLRNGSSRLPAVEDALHEINVSLVFRYELKSVETVVFHFSKERRVADDERRDEKRSTSDDAWRSLVLF